MYFPMGFMRFNALPHNDKRPALLVLRHHSYDVMSVWGCWPGVSSGWSVPFDKSRSGRIQLADVKYEHASEGPITHSSPC